MRVTDAITGNPVIIDSNAAVAASPLAWRRISTILPAQTAGLLSILDVNGDLFDERELLALCCVSKGVKIALHSHVCWLSTQTAALVYNQHRQPERQPERAPVPVESAESVPARAARVHLTAAARQGVRRAWAAVDSFHHFRLHSALGVALFPLLPDWHVGASAQEVATLELALGAIHLPPAFLASLLMRNGQPRDAPLHSRLYGARLLCCAELIGVYAQWRTSLASLAGVGAEWAASFAVHGKPPGLYVDPRYLLPVSDVFEGGKRLAVDILVSPGPVYVLDGLAAATFAARDWEAFLWGTVS